MLNKTLKIVFVCFLFLTFSCKEKPQTTENIAKTETPPKPTIILYPEASKKLTLAEKTGQLFMPAAYINDDEENIQALEKLIKEQNIGALCFFHSRTSVVTNFNGKKQEELNKDDLKNIKKLIARYQKAAKHPLLIAVDAEWGLAMRVENAPKYPYAITLGAMQTENDLAYEVGKNIGKDCRDAGIHWNLAPVVDINNNPNNPVIGFRSFGDNKHEVTRLGTSYVNGLEASGLLSSLKHFPGHGDTETDSHIGLPVITKTKEELVNNELYPFQAIIENEVDAIMIAHLAIPSLTKEKNTPTTLSKETLKNVLRKEMNFKGAIISDALNMKSVSKMYPVKGELEWVAFNAGNDMLCFSENPKEGIETLLKNATPAQIEESFKRIWKLKEKANTPIKTESNKYSEIALNTEIAKASLTLLKGNSDSISKLKNESFIGLEISEDADRSFFKSIQKEIKFEQFSTATSPIAALNKEMTVSDNIVIALYPPLVKPSGNFGLTKEEINMISNLAKHKKVTLYLFGNPYALNVIDTSNIENIVLVYQNFEVFQENAAQHFLGKIEAKGKLPVKLGSE
mgnify:CR=1 FL=1